MKILEEEERMLLVEMPRSRIGLDLVAIEEVSMLDLTLVPIGDISID